MAESNCGENKIKTAAKSKKIFNPLEVAFCGYSGSGKTTLIKSVLEHLSPLKRIAYIKHDAHQFTMDVEGKDTWVAKKAGANVVAIHNPHHFAILGDGFDEYRAFQKFVDYDAVIVEGYKGRHIPKILVLDSQGKLFAEFIAGSYENVIAVVGVEEDLAGLPEGCPYFQRDQTKQVAAFVQGYWGQQIANRPLKGLLLMGGKSSRMGFDKASLAYSGQLQYQRAHQFLSHFCQEVFLSVRHENQEIDLPQIEDRFLDFGPMGGILSAMKNDENAAWFVMACDLPFVSQSLGEILRDRRNGHCNATAFQSQTEPFPEPLFAIYEPKAMHALMGFMALGYHCPRKVLINSAIELVENSIMDSLANVNTKEEYAEACLKLEKGES